MNKRQKNINSIITWYYYIVKGGIIQEVLTNIRINVYEISPQTC